MRRMILIPVLIVVVLMALIGGVAYFVYNNYIYYTTDDAQVTGSIVPVSTTAAGKLNTLSVKLGDKVTANETIGTITNPQGTLVKIVSPIDGTIVQTSAVEGQYVSAGLPVAQVTDLNNLSITAYVDESQINNVKQGQDVDIKVDAYSDTNITGHVQQIVNATAGSFSILPTEDNASGNFTKVGQRIPVVISLSGNAGKQIVPGMSTTVTIHIH
jgi:multidrug resistance efflux pump